jgi:hypothetical protein
MKTYRMIGLGLAAGLALATVNTNAQIKNAPHRHNSESRSEFHERSH